MIPVNLSYIYSARWRKSDNVCCDKKTDVAKDERQDFAWLTCAAEQGDAEAQCSLGYCYDRGSGVAKDVGIEATETLNFHKGGHCPGIFHQAF